MAPLLAAAADSILRNHFAKSASGRWLRSVAAAAVERKWATPPIAESAALPCFSPENRDIFQEKQGGD
jgi:hypothetical protein